MNIGFFSKYGLLVILSILLFGCADHCIRPNDSTGSTIASGVVSTKQKWTESNVSISDTIKITKIDIEPRSISFHLNQSEIFPVSVGKHEFSLPFDLKPGDKLQFNVVGSIICKNQENGNTRYIKAGGKCNDGNKDGKRSEIPYFVNILNQPSCEENKEKDIICPNKHTLEGAEWFHGKEYYTERELQDTIQKIAGKKYKDKNDLCNSAEAKELDTYALNIVCEKICNPHNEKDSNCVCTESVKERLLSGGREIIGKSIDNQIQIHRDNDVETYIPNLSVEMDSENFVAVCKHNTTYDYILTNYGYEIENDHKSDAKLKFNLTGDGQGGFNIMVTKYTDPSKGHLCIHVSDSIPTHNPGDNEKDIPVDIDKISDPEYVNSLKSKVNEKKGTIYYGIRDHSDKNKGNFLISIKTKEPPYRNVSVLYNFLDKKVKEAFFGSQYNATTGEIDFTFTQESKSSHGRSDNKQNRSPVKAIYQNFVLDKTSSFRQTIISLLLLYIVLYTLYFFFGLSNSSIYEFLIICVKIGMIAALLKDNSWDYFYNEAFSLFVNAPTELIGGIAGGQDVNQKNVFEFLDLPLNRLISQNSLTLLISLIFSGPLGILAFFLVIWGIVILVLSIFNAMFSFVTSVVIVALLLSLSPVFIVCILFQRTRDMFHSWIRHLARFAIHPVILLLVISLINQVINYVIYSVFDFEACTQCIFPIDLSIIPTFCILYGYVAKGAPNIAAIMAFIILGHAVKAMTKASSVISDSLFGVFVLEDQGRHYKENLLGFVGLDQESQQRGVYGGTSGAAPIQERKPIDRPRSLQSNRPQVDKP